MEQKSSLTGPLIQTEIPGTRSQEWIDRLALRECPAITARRSRRAMTLGTAKDDPIVWKQAEGSVVQDVDGNCFYRSYCWIWSCRCRSSQSQSSTSLPTINSIYSYMPWEMPLQILPE